MSPAVDPRRLPARLPATRPLPAFPWRESIGAGKSPVYLVSCKSTRVVSLTNGRGFPASPALLSFSHFCPATDIPPLGRAANEGRRGEESDRFEASIDVARIRSTLHRGLSTYIPRSMTIVEKIVEYISWNGMDQKYRARKWIDYYSEKIYKILSERRIIKRSYIFDALFNSHL